MAYTQQNGDFSAFVNDYKQNDRQPDFKGKGVDLNGHACDIAIWKRTSQNGKQYFSIKLSAPRDPYQKNVAEMQQAAQQAAAQQPATPARPQVIGSDPAYHTAEVDDLPFD